MGITNGNDSQYKPTIDTQVCIIGSGPAGITAAWHLYKKGIKNITLIEGSRTIDDLIASREDKRYLYNGTADGLFTTNEPEFLLLPYPEAHDSCEERERFYGGTSAHWAGQCRPLDPITFEQRTGFPGWPIKRTDLDPYYAEACKFLNLVGAYYDSDKKAGYNFTTAYWAPLLGAKDPKLEGFDTEMYQFPAGDLNFATREFDDGNHKKTIGQTDVNVIVNATLLDIDHDNGFVRRVHVASMDESSPPHAKQEFFIRADAYVLACGAVANARQLLLSNVGNEHYQVGHYFMCHPIPRWDFHVVNIERNPKPEPFLTEDEAKLMTYWTDPTGVRVTGKISPKAEQQRDLKIGGCWFDATKAGFPGKGYYYEMQPNYASCVTLDDTTDQVFKQKQTKITWKLSDTD
jgi:hypothetical protein